MAIEFENILSEWARDSAGLSIARNRLAELERKRGTPLPDKARQGFIDSARIAIMLNSVTDIDIDKLRPIREWAKQHSEGWPILFYCAGILLSVERAFPAQSVTSGVLMFSHSAKDKTKLLLQHYSQLDTWKRN